MEIWVFLDIIIYRTRSDRLHSDTFQFLGDASAAYLKYFTSELKAISESNKVSVSNLGPALIVFHETSFTEPLKDDGELMQWSLNIYFFATFSGEKTGINTLACSLIAIL